MNGAVPLSPVCLHGGGVTTRLPLVPRLVGTGVPPVCLKVSCCKLLVARINIPGRLT
jgi:hypothetical protein